MSFVIPDELFHGVLTVEDGYPCRLTPCVRSFFAEKSKEFADRSGCTAGVHIRFRSAAQKLHALFRAECFCRSQNVVDIYENGIQTGSVRLADMQSHAEMNFISPGTGFREFDLWLPNTCGLRLVDFDFGEYEAIPKNQKKLLLLGDSILQGICSYHPSNALANQISISWGADCVNQSVGGASYMPETLEPVDFPPDHILVALGANDSYELREVWEKKIPVYYGKLRELNPHTPVITITPIWNARLKWDENYKENIHAVRECIQVQAAKYSISMIDGLSLVPHSERFFNEDGCHPNDMGFLRYSLSLMQNPEWIRWKDSSRI